MPKRRKYYRDIMFGYMHSPEFNFVGEDGGFSIAIYPDGRFIHKTYITDFIDDFEKTKKEIMLSEELVREISIVLHEYENEIAGFRRNLDNGSEKENGNGYYFVFNGKRVFTWNIEYRDEEQLKKEKPEHYRNDLSVIRQENVMINIFQKISQLLRRAGIDLNLSSVCYSEKEDDLEI